MYEVMQSLTETQKLQIGDELEKLFSLHDRPFSKSKSANFIEEFEKTGIPASAIISGIRGLFYEETGQIRFPQLVNAARSKIEHDEIITSECDHCYKMGLVMMRDDSNYEFSFLCTCGNAQKMEHLMTTRWNGEQFQLYRGKTFKKRFS